MQLDKNYFPGFTRKSLCFSIDDGNVPLDKKFIDIVRPAGIFGTFNLSGVNLDKYTREYYLQLYDGFGIANHCKLHPYALDPDAEYKISEDDFNPDNISDGVLFKTERAGVYQIHMPRGWRRIADRDTYLRLVDEAKEEIEATFGEGSARSFVWPFCRQKDDKIHQGIIERGYRSIRGVGRISDTTGYRIPEDKFDWRFNADHTNLIIEGERYEKYPDDGELKFFVFGVHSHDFENNNCWNVLEAFAQRFGNRREVFYSAPVDEIFDYCEAVDSLVIEDNRVYNPSNIPLYMKLNGEYIILPPGASQKL